MKKMKKIFALAIALVMVLGMSTSVFAASIQITHDSSYEGGTGTTARVYNAYKVFDASYTSLSGENTQAAKDTFTYTPDGAAVAYSMATDSPWLSVMQATGQTWFDVKLAADGSKYVVTPKKDASGNSLYSTETHAKAFAAYLEDKVPATATATEVTVDATATTVDPGYYIVIAKDGKDGATKVALVTTDVKMFEKNTYITTGKTTSETSYSVGDTVTYTATVEIPADTAVSELKDGSTTEYKDGHKPIVLHDKMDTQLTFKNDVSAKIGEAAFTGFTVTYTANTSAANGATAQTDGCTFEVTIPVTSDLLGKTITFTYTAEVNSTAADDTGYVNELFGELNGYKTNPDSPKVYTFDFDLDKNFQNVTGDAAANYSATFELYNVDPSTITTTYYTDDTYTTVSETATEYSKTSASAIEVIAVTGGYKKADSDDTGKTTSMTINGKDNINISGLKAGDYWLVETATATGYNLLDAPVKVTIVDTTDTTQANWTPSHTVNGGTAAVEVVNNQGSVLPSTGGIGTTIFYVIGAILVIGAGVVLVTRRRMNVQ